MDGKPEGDDDDDDDDDGGDKEDDDKGEYDDEEAGDFSLLLDDVDDGEDEGREGDCAKALGTGFSAEKGQTPAVTAASERSVTHSGTAELVPPAPLLPSACRNRSVSRRYPRLYHLARRHAGNGPCI